MRTDTDQVLTLNLIPLPFRATLTKAVRIPRKMMTRALRVTILPPVASLLVEMSAKFVTAERR